MKKLTCAVLALLMLLGSLTACTTTPSDTDNGETTPAGDTTAADTTASTTAPTETTAPGTTAKPDDPKEPENQVLLEALELYQVVYPANNKTVKAAAELLCEHLTGLSEDKTFVVVSDAVAPIKHEFLVGVTNREETRVLQKEYRLSDYGYALVGQKVLLFSHTDELATDAVELFADDLLTQKKLADGVLIAESEADSIAPVYEIGRVTLEGTQIKKCVLVYPEGDAFEKQTAEEISAYLLKNTTYFVEVISDKVASPEGFHEILVGQTNRSQALPSELARFGCKVTSKAGVTQLGGVEPAAIALAADYFCDAFVLDSGSLAVNLADFQMDASETDMQMRVMTFNLQSWDKTEVRTKNLCDQVVEYMPDIIGVQEATPSWLESLSKVLPGYTYVGLGREEIQNTEYCAVFYNKQKFDLIETQTKWLSATPDVQGSKYPSSDYVRIMTWAVLERKLDGKQFVMANTHLDWGALQQQTNVILDFMKQYQDVPVFLTGDFNMKTTHAAYKTLVNQGFVDLATITERFTGDVTYQSTQHFAEKIDYIMLRGSDATTVLQFRVCNEKLTGGVSDHYALFTDVLLP